MSTAVTREHDAHVHCPNCEALLTGHYCANCGQEAILHHASTREFLHEFIGHYVALEGKLWGTVLRLLCRPGALTLEYIRGRRVRFVQPLRLYLTLSLLFFAILKFSGGLTFGDMPREQGATKAGASKAASAAISAADQARNAARVIEHGAVGGASAQDKADAKAAIGALQQDLQRAQAAASAPARDDEHDIDNVLDPDGAFLRRWPKLRHQWQAFEDLPSDQKGKVFTEGFFHYAPYAIFCLMPVFAFLLKLLYLGSGKRFGEHLLFALHSNAFAYFIFCVILLVPSGLLTFILWCWLLAYLPWAMWRVYGGRRWGVLLRWAALMSCYSLAIGLAVLASMLGGVMSVGAH